MGEKNHRFGTSPSKETIEQGIETKIKNGTTGKGRITTNDTKLKQSMVKSGENNPNYRKICIYNQKLDKMKYIKEEELENFIKGEWRKGGRPASKITKVKISKTLEGNTRNLGKKLSPASITKREATRKLKRMIKKIVDIFFD